MVAWSGHLDFIDALKLAVPGRNGERLPSEVIWPQPVSRFHLEGSSLPVCDDSATIPAEVLDIVNDTSTADISRSSCDHGLGDSSNS
ncbi:hypothetical protein LDL36_16640 [Komagataeibacter sp. FNDCR1]|nr:hypothetical protein [Komagataeibacter sp. FNDCR1]